MKTLILIFGCLLLVIPSQAAEKQQQLSNPNQQFEEIERYIARLRQGIENYYANQLIEVKQRAEAEIELLEAADNLDYATLAAQAEVAKTVLNIYDYGYRTPQYLEAKIERMQQIKKEHRYGYFADSIEISPERFAVAQSQIAERKSDILAKLEYETADLERQKNYALTVTLPELEKRLKEDLLRPEPAPTHGLVTGIVYSADKPCAVIDRKIVYEGDVIYGATVVKIYRDSVKFSKKSKNWEQKVQQAPEAYW
jgi:multidrug efflux pump subunit AcrA (membrane-fusion protein)